LQSNQNVGEKKMPSFIGYLDFYVRQMRKTQSMLKTLKCLGEGIRKGCIVNGGLDARLGVT
jgi:hypothetical protein